MKLDQTLNGWSTIDMNLYNDLTVEERHRLDRALLLEIDEHIPFFRNSFKMVYYVTLKRRPKELFKDKKVSELHIKILEKEIDNLKYMFKLS